MKMFMKEQASARGDFPGSNWKAAVEEGAELVVISYEGFENDDTHS